MAESVGYFPCLGSDGTPTRILPTECVATLFDYQHRDDFHLTPYSGIPLYVAIQAVQAQ